VRPGYCDNFLRYFLDIALKRRIQILKKGFKEDQKTPDPEHWLVEKLREIQVIL
jgi:hypothetical protein